MTGLASTSGDPAQQRRAAITGLLAGLAATTMLFASLASAYIVRRGISDNWTRLDIPVTLYFSVIPAAAVSVLLESTRRREHPSLPSRARKQAALLLAATAFAILFIATHVYVWRNYARDGAGAVDFLSLTSVIVVLYALCGTVGLLALFLRRQRPIGLVYYWHYLNALWAFLLVFFYVLR